MRSKAAAIVVAPLMFLSVPLAGAQPTTTEVPIPDYSDGGGMPDYGSGGGSVPDAPAYTPVAPVAPAYTPPAYTPEPTPVYTPPPEPAYTADPVPEPVQPPAPTSDSAPEPAYTPEPTPVYTPEPTPESPPESSAELPTTTVTEQAPAETPTSEPATSEPATPEPTAETPEEETSEIPTSADAPSSTADAPVTSGVEPAESETAETSAAETATPTVAAPTTVAPPPDGVEEAKAAPPEYVDAVAPPPPPAEYSDFSKEVTKVIQANPNIVVNNNITTVNNWTYIDYDDWHRPVFYNPYDYGYNVRYYYESSWRVVWIPPRQRIVLSVSIGGVFPFTAVGGGYIQAGYFQGGCWTPPPTCVTCGPPPGWRPPPPPVVYNNVSVNLVSINRQAMVKKVTVVGRDNSKPVGQQDVFMLDDTKLAWGTNDDGNISVAEVQGTPGVGPTDPGDILLASNDDDLDKDEDNTVWYLVAIAAFLSVLVGVVMWALRRVGRQGRQSNPQDPGHPPAGYQQP